jgi:predicted NUDIX family NTP pyrophosphohydrolase
MARSRHSAGILAYRRCERLLEVFLVHPGGPYWMKRDEGAWSIPKGEYLPGQEQALQAARREFHEETGLALPESALPLTPVRQPGGKLITAWAVEAPDLDPEQLRSNHFTLEWPPASGQQRSFPEVDRAAWFPLTEAHRRLIAGQRALLAELTRLLAWPGDSQ